MRASPIFRRLSLIVPAACLAAVFAAACRPGAEKSADRAAAAPAVFPLEEATIAGLQEMMGSGGPPRKASSPCTSSGSASSTGAAPASTPSSRSTPTLSTSPGRSTASATRKGRAGRCTASRSCIKDNIDTADRMETTAGSLALLGSMPAQDAFVVERLRAAGAVILGKTNLSEWANFRSTHSSSGWSGRGGQTRNPYALDRNPSGSSSGSAVAVAANLAAVGRRHRDRRLDRLARLGQRHRRPQADGRPGQPRRHHPDRPHPGHGRADGPHGRRRRDPARRAGRAGSARSRDRPEAPGNSRRIRRTFLDPDGLRGARIGILNPRCFDLLREARARPAAAPSRR